MKLKNLILLIVILLLILLLAFMFYILIINNCQSNFNNYEYINSHKIKYYGLRSDINEKSLISKIK